MARQVGQPGSHHMTDADHASCRNPSHNQLQCPQLSASRHLVLPGLLGVTGKGRHPKVLPTFPPLMSQMTGEKYHKRKVMSLSLANKNLYTPNMTATRRKYRGARGKWPGK